MTEEYKAYLKSRQMCPPSEDADFLAHYGVKGQKWGVRNYQYADGGYTPAGAERYWGGTGQGRRAPAASNGGIRGAQSARRPMGTRQISNSSQNGRSQLSPEQRAARRAQTKRIIGITAGVAVAAAVGYGAYKGYKKSGEWQNQMRSDVYRNFDTDHSHLHTMNSKYWNSDDRRKYSELTKQRADFVANNITRRDAVAAKFAEKTGIQVNLPQSRERAMAQRRNENQYANFIRDAEKRGSLNRQISEARRDLRETQRIAARSDASRSRIQEERYGDMWRKQHEKNIQAQRERLNSLLEKRRAS